MKKFVWDASALVNIKEPNASGYSPGHSLFKDLADGWISGPYQNIFPAIAAFEIDATVSKLHRKGKQILREFYIVNDTAKIYAIDQELISKSVEFVDKDGFSKLHGADLIYACIAHLEDAYLVTLDKHFEAVSGTVKVINLNESRDDPNYRRLFGI
ncbi:MAG: PIN domain-containing protein [Herminiimonas sp.]|uniref:PIN domain-containing protein n=1 Tax=Herminiimonas sp. TaxID=1926289 RepID=UPI00271D9536|nr:PIN domain-containing protein [Herminiimonas sp.]MDO9420909.1 PIN domain-containing protein [Herminiimonas sp.]